MISKATTKSTGDLAGLPGVGLVSADAALEEPDMIPVLMPTGPLPWIGTFHFQGSSRYLRRRRSIASDVWLPARSDSGSVNAHSHGALCSVRESGRKRVIVLRRLTGIGSSHKSRRVVATVAATLLLAAQLIAAAHVHPGMLIKSVSDGARIGAAEIACPVCIFHAYSATNAAGTFMLVVPFLGEAFVATATQSRLLSTPKPQLFGRAPPASA